MKTKLIIFISTLAMYQAKAIFNTAESQALISTYNNMSANTDPMTARQYATLFMAMVITDTKNPDLMNTNNPLEAARYIIDVNRENWKGHKATMLINAHAVAKETEEPRYANFIQAFESTRLERLRSCCPSEGRIFDAVKKLMPTKQTTVQKRGTEPFTAIEMSRTTLNSSSVTDKLSAQLGEIHFMWQAKGFKTNENETQLRARFDNLTQDAISLVKTDLSSNSARIASAIMAYNEYFKSCVYSYKHKPSIALPFIATALSTAVIIGAIYAALYNTTNPDNVLQQKDSGPAQTAVINYLTCIAQKGFNTTSTALANGSFNASNILQVCANPYGVTLNSGPTLDIYSAGAMSPITTLISAIISTTTQAITDVALTIQDLDVAQSTLIKAINANPNCPALQEALTLTNEALGNVTQADTELTAALTNFTKELS